MTLWRYTNLRIIFFLNQEHKATNDEKNHKKRSTTEMTHFGWSSGTKLLCSRTELKCCTTTEIRWNINETSRRSPDTAVIGLPMSLSKRCASSSSEVRVSTAAGQNLHSGVRLLYYYI